jgi:hypothetical protein
MSTVLELMPRLIGETEQDAAPVEAVSDRSCANEGVSHAYPSIAEEQIGGLVRQIFVSCGKKKIRQVLFSPVDEETQIVGLCMLVGQVLNAQNFGTICVVEALPRWAAKHVRAIDAPISPQPKFGVLRDSAQQLSNRLWFMPSQVLCDGAGSQWSASWIRGRLAELRLDFDYTVLQGPQAGIHDEAGLLASLCDGVVLVLRANATRRVVAQKVSEKLHAANVRVLGAVMTERTFPIPEALYRKL